MDNTQNTRAVENVSALFRKWDTNQSGTVHRKHLPPVLQYKLCTDEIDLLLDSAGMTNREYINYDTFLQFIFQDIPPSY